MGGRRLGWVLVLIMVLGALVGGCKKKKAGTLGAQAINDGLPAWMSNPCFDCESEEMAGFGRSDIAAIDFNTAKGEAEAMALAHVGQQLQTEVDYLMEIAAEIYTDIEPEQMVNLGNRTVKQMDQTFVHQTIRGAEFVDYYYLPDPTTPQSIMVRAKISLAREELANDLLGAFERELGALEDELELNHEENMLRLEQVRDAYLNRQGR